MRVLLSEEMRNLDQVTEKNIGIPQVLLMENAGHAIASVAETYLEGCAGAKIIILAGKGNNGGDGFSSARWLQNRGSEVIVFLSNAETEVQGAASEELQFFLNAGGQVETINSGDELEMLANICKEADLIIDALLGTGFVGELTPKYREFCKCINQAEGIVLAVDIPTGVEADTGFVDENAVMADVTVTMALPKVGLYLYPAVDYVGEVLVADIGIPANIIAQNTEKRFLLTEEIVLNLMPLRLGNAHKGDAGRVAVVAGSPSYTGAAALCSEAAVKIGAGLVTLMTSASVKDILSVKLTEVMVRPLSENAPGNLTASAGIDVLNMAEKVNVLAIGPGLGDSEGTAEVVRSILKNIETPCVLDADGINALIDNIDVLKTMIAPKVLTPHPGELARLIDADSEYVDANRVELAKRFAKEWNAVLVLKGAPTVIASPDGSVYLNTTGNASMATAGSGDVLTGVIAGLIGQGSTSLEAALVGVYLHGLAGDLATDGMVGLKASEIIDNLAAARLAIYSVNA